MSLLLNNSQFFEVLTLFSVLSEQIYLVGKSKLRKLRLVAMLAMEISLLFRVEHREAKVGLVLLPYFEIV